MSNPTRIDSIKAAYDAARFEHHTVGGSEMPAWDDLEWCMQSAFINAYYRGRSDAFAIGRDKKEASSEGAAA